MSKFAVGETVYLAASLLNPPAQQAFEYAMASGKIVSIQNQTGKGGNRAEIEYSTSSGPATSPPISVSKLHKRLGVLVLRIGDIGSEELLLDPLANSVRDFCRLLVDQVTLVSVRSVAELAAWCSHNGNVGLYSHIILVGHGSQSSIDFAVGGSQNANAIGKALTVKKSNKKVILSMACETGDSLFAKPMSKTSPCLFFIGPETAGSAAMGSLFCQSFLTENIVDGATPGVAFRHVANQFANRQPTYALWRGGNKQA